MATARQPSFARGEFSPTMWSRTEFEGYRLGARTLLNFIVNPHGAAMNRPGTFYVGRTRNDDPFRMREFKYAESDTLLLVFTPLRLRFYARAGGAYGEVQVAGVPLEVVTPYVAADLDKLRFTQVGNAVRIACRGHELRLLARTGTAPLAFTFDVLTFDVPAPNGVVYLDVRALTNVEDGSHPSRAWGYLVTELWRDESGFVWETSPLPVLGPVVFWYRAWSAVIPYPLGAKVNDGGHTYRSIQAANLNHAVGDAAWWADEGAAIGASPPPFFVLPVPANLVLFPDRKLGLTTTDAWGLTVGGAVARRIARRVYRGRGQTFGYVGEFEGTTFEDSGDDPDWTMAPPKGENPFNVEDVNGNVIRVEHPSACVHHDQRFMAAATLERPGHVFVSALDDYANFDRHEPLLPDDSFSLELAAEEREEIRALVSGTFLWLFTDAQEWAGSGSGDQRSMDATSYAFHPRTSFGSGWLEPVKAGDDEMFFFPAAGDVVRHLAPDANATQRFQAADETLLARHMFEGKVIVDRAWQVRPFPVLWVAFSDGTFASLSWSRANGVAAWTPHTTDGAVERLCIVREGADDALYLGVRRTIGGVARRYIERLDTARLRGVKDLARSLFLDSALRFDAPGEPASHFYGLGHLEGRTVNALADGFIVRGLVVKDGSVDLPADAFPDGASVVSVGLPYRSDFDSLDVPPGEGKRRVKVVADVTLELEASRSPYVGIELPADGGTDGMEEAMPLTSLEGLGPAGLHSGPYRVPVAGEYDTGGRCSVRHVDPVPLTILAVIREVEYGA